MKLKIDEYGHQIMIPFATVGINIKKKADQAN
jgi:hypothetical protein